jgi:hypothetical protein
MNLPVVPGADAVGLGVASSLRGCGLAVERKGRDIGGKAVRQDNDGVDEGSDAPGSAEGAGRRQGSTAILISL